MSLTDFLFTVCHISTWDITTLAATSFCGGFKMNAQVSAKIQALEIWVALMNFFINKLCENTTKDVMLDQTTYGPTRSACWGAQDRPLLGPYSPGATLGVKTHCFGPWAQVSPRQAKKICQKAPNLNQ